MNPAPAVRRLARALAAALAAALACAAAPAALASGPGPLPPAAPQPIRWFPPGWNKHPPLPGPAHLHAALAGGLPGWQITLIMAAAGLLAAALAMIVYRLRAARRRVSATAA